MKNAFVFKLDFIARAGFVKNIIEDTKDSYFISMLFDKKICPLEINSNGEWKFSMQNEPKYMFTIYYDRKYDSNYNGVQFYRIPDISYTKQIIHTEEIGGLTLSSFDNRVDSYKSEFNDKAELRKNENEDENAKIIQKMVLEYVKFFMR